MSALENLRLKRETRDATAAKSREAAAAARAGRQRVSALKAQLQQLRQGAVAQRIAANDILSPTAIRAADLQEVALDLEAAEINAQRLANDQERLQQTANTAYAAWRKAVCRVAQEHEATALAEVEAALAALAAACARAIAAAKVSLDFGEIRGRHTLPTTAWYGSGGRLVAHLREMSWPTWPNVIDPGPFRSRYTREPLVNFAGVEEEEANLLTIIGEAEAE